MMRAARPAGAGGLLLATKRPDSGAERRIYALGDQTTLLGHLSPVEARLASTRLLLAECMIPAGLP